MIIIIDYGLGNLGSIKNMLKKIGVSAVVSTDINLIDQADKLILPGVGAFDNGMANLNNRGLIPVLNKKVFESRTPIIGLCLGMQLFTNKSEEGVLPGLGWIEGETRRFKFDGAEQKLKVPHMGWNTVEPCRPSPIFDGYDDKPRYYFVHSYYVNCSNPENCLATTEYGFDFTSAVIKDNIVGVQFHPEKSHRFGMQLLKNFVEKFN